VNQKTTTALKKIALPVGLLMVVVLVGAGWYFLKGPGGKSNTDIAQTAQDCTSLEKYDAEAKQCYFECDTDEQCAQIESKIEAELSGFFQGATTKAGKSPSQEASDPGSSSSSTVINNRETKDKIQSVDPSASSEGKTVYNYKDRRISPDFRSKKETDIWESFLAIADRDFADQYISQVSYFNDSDNTTAASVTISPNDAKKWDLEVNLAYADDQKDLLMTLVHEYAHVYSLNTSQLDSNDTGVCPLLVLSEGCTRGSSIIQQFTTKFWADNNNELESQDFGKYYPGHESEFVSEYAATNAVEDFAESFARHALGVSSYPDGAKPKIEFMSTNPDIQKNSQRIRANLGLELKSRNLIR
jgi:hypothetical protein